jgi:DNA-binding MarR family transcriptional regulator
LRKKGLVQTEASTSDLRRLDVSLTAAGEVFVAATVPLALEVSTKTAKAMTARERAQILTILSKI